jgi:hypothetical protein
MNYYKHNSETNMLSTGCCNNNCGRNSHQFYSTNTNNIVPVCCIGCITKIHTPECNNRQRKTTLCLCGCKRFVECGINMNTGNHFLYCCTDCAISQFETTIHPHSQSCNEKYIKLQEELSSIYAKQSLPTPILSPKIRPFEKDEMQAFNLALKKNEIHNAIKIIKLKLINPNMINDATKEIIIRILHASSIDQQASANNTTNINEGIMLFNEIFLEKQLFQINEAVISIAIRLYSNANVSLDNMLKFIVKIFNEIEISKRIYSSIFEYCKKTNNIILALQLLRIGVVKKIIFSNSDYENIFSSIYLSETSNNFQNLLKNKKYATEIMIYMRGQSLANITDKETDITIKTIDMKEAYITQKTAEILCSVFERQLHSSIINLGTTLDICPKCKNNIAKFQLSETDKNEMLTFIEQATIKQHNLKKVNKILKTISEFPTDFVIDGANIGYSEYQGNIFFDFNKINSVVHKLNGNIIMFLHERHLKNLSERDANIVLKWNSSKTIKLIETPFDTYDDLIWMYCAIYNDSMFVSNDELKDHYINIYSKISPQKFRLWKELHQIFHDKRTTNLTFPPKILTQIQYQNNTPEIQFNFWHLPILNHHKGLWLCLDM